MGDQVLSNVDNEAFVLGSRPAFHFDHWPDELFKMIESEEESGSRRQRHSEIASFSFVWMDDKELLVSRLARCLIIRNCNIEHLSICERLLMRKLLDYTRGFCLPSIELHPILHVILAFHFSHLFLFNNRSSNKKHVFSAASFLLCSINSL